MSAHVLLYQLHEFRGGCRISEKGIHMFKRLRVLFSDFISFFLNIP